MCLYLSQRRILEYTKYEMLNKALDAFGDLADDEELGPTDWPTVKRYIASLNNVEGEFVHPHTVYESDENLYPTSLKDIRVRLLNGEYTFGVSSSLGISFGQFFNQQHQCIVLMRM